MRDFAKLAPKFWTGSTGRKLHAQGPETTVLAAYLISSPHSNAIGMYYLPRIYMAHDTGLGMEGSRKGLERAIEAGFCHYDDSTEMVFVPEMARMQIAEHLEPKDKRVRWVQKEYDALPENPFLAEFYRRYAGRFHMTRMRGETIDGVSPSEAPSKPLPSQETEIEIEQEIEQETEQETTLSSKADGSGQQHEQTLETWLDDANFGGATRS